MFKQLRYQVAATAAVGIVFVAIVSGQTRSAPPAGSSDELLREVRALRADLNQRLDAGLRAQLLVARLGLQEQRITALSRQLTDVQQQLLNNERGRGPLEAQLKMFEGQASDSAEQKKEADFILNPLRSQVEQMAKAEEELKRQQVYLTGLIAEEQARWTAFNARLEELEAILTPQPGRRQP